MSSSPSLHLVTGGSGFIGAGLVAELLARGQRVRVLDDHSRGRPARLQPLLDGPHGAALEVVTGDVRRLDDVLAATRDCAFVWHLAYVNGTRFFYEKPDLVLEVGIKGALNTVEAALACGVRRYVLASTSETYNTPTHVQDAMDTVDSPLKASTLLCNRASNEEIADRVPPCCSPLGREAVLEQGTGGGLCICESDQAVAEVANGRNAEAVAQNAR
jgi:nucleoside-diphosphate-sugar epimerase